MSGNVPLTAEAQMYRRADLTECSPGLKIADPFSHPQYPPLAPFKAGQAMLRDDYSLSFGKALVRNKSKAVLRDIHDNALARVSGFVAKNKLKNNNRFVASLSSIVLQFFCLLLPLRKKFLMNFLAINASQGKWHSAQSAHRDFLPAILTDAVGPFGHLLEGRLYHAQSRPVTVQV
jgi:hypothetical protein